MTTGTQNAGSPDDTVRLTIETSREIKDAILSVARACGQTPSEYVEAVIVKRWDALKDSDQARIASSQHQETQRTIALLASIVLSNHRARNDGVEGIFGPTPNR